MIDLTPLDVKKKKGDFRRGMRGYDSVEVDQFLDLTAERLEELVHENLTLKERVDRLSDQLDGQEGRERAVQEALVTAQSLREEVKDQARREAEFIIREAEAAAEKVRAETEKVLQEGRRTLLELHRMRSRFLKGFRTFLERELDAVEAEELNPIPSDFDVEALEAEVGLEQLSSAKTSSAPLDENAESDAASDVRLDDRGPPGDLDAPVSGRGE